MLVILFGSTVEMGKQSRQYFIENGFELVHKYNYVPDNFEFPFRFGKRQQASKEEVLKCDFIYESNGMLIGFNKEQIIDAVRGRRKSLLTTSATTIDFIRQIKAVYGEYVTVIGTYIDDRTLETLFKKLPGVTEKELEIRIAIGKQIKKSILSDRKLFDYIVVYGGEESAFNYDALKIQYDYMIRRAESQEKELNDKMYVEMPYTGGDDYVFVSYSHDDIGKVFPVLHKLQVAGFRVWYDEGINGGENWRKILASKIEEEKCREFLLFASENSVQSRHVKAELNLALDLEKKITTIRLDNAKFGSDLEMYLSTYQYICTSNDEVFYEKVIRSMDTATRIKI